MKALLSYWGVTLWYGFKARLVYRWSAWLGSFAMGATFVIRVAVWGALLMDGVRFDTSFEQMLTFLILTKVAQSLVQSFSGNTIADLIRSGDISMYLMRPIHLKTHLMLGDMGSNLFTTFMVTEAPYAWFLPSPTALYGPRIR